MIGAGGIPRGTTRSWSISSIIRSSRFWTTAASRARKHGSKNVRPSRLLAEIAVVYMPRQPAPQVRQVADSSSFAPISSGNIRHASSFAAAGPHVQRDCKADRIRAPQHRELEIVGQIDQGDDLSFIIARCDVVIDFSSHNATAAIADFCSNHGKALVVGTTGHDDNEKSRITHHAARIPMVLSSNYSTGVNTLFWLTRKAAEILGPAMISKWWKCIIV